MDFIAIDFETATALSDSACSLGLVFVDNLQIIDKKYYLIKPPNLDFDNSNIDIHGITPDMVRDSHCFSDVWLRIKNYFNGDNLIVAHNSSFDMSVLWCCLESCGYTIPNFPYADSISLTTPKETIGTSLVDRCKFYSVTLADHHDALADATACAEIVIKALEMSGFHSFNSYMLRRNRFVKNFVELNPMRSMIGSKIKKYKNASIRISELAATVDEFDDLHPFYQKNFVFTGELRTIGRKEAMQKVLNCGGCVKSGVSSKTHYLIVGLQDNSIVGDDGLSSKEEKAYDLIEQGHDIQILNEQEFLSILNED